MGMVVKDASVRCFEGFFVGRMKDDGPAQGESRTDFDVSAEAAGKHHDQNVGVADGFQFVLRDSGVLICALTILTCPSESALPTVSLEDG